MMLGKTRRKRYIDQRTESRKKFHTAKIKASKKEMDFYTIEAFKAGADWALRYIRKNYHASL